MNRLKKTVPVLFALCALNCGASAAFPDKPVHLIVGMAAGGGADTVARIVAQKVSENWNQAVVVEDRPGADGSIAADVVAHAVPDGYTLVWITNAHTITPSEFKLNYDPIKSFAPISLMSEAPDVLLVHPDLKVNNAKELIAYAKANPGKLNFGDGGIGTSGFLEMALLMKMTGTQMQHVSYKGGNEVMAALLANYVQLRFTNMATAVAPVKSGKVKALAVSTKMRSPAMPDVPTVAEALNLPGFEGSDWLGVLAPAGTPKDIVAKLNQGFVDAIKSPDVQKRLADLGWASVANSPDEFTGIMRSEIPRWAPLLKDLDVK